MKSPVITTLCGSTKFKQQFRNMEKTLTLQGHIVLTCGLFAHAEKIHLTPKQKTELDELHQAKIRMSHEIVVINFNPNSSLEPSYIGESTQREIEYARSLGKCIYFTYLRDERDVFNNDRQLWEPLEQSIKKWETGECY